ncbi:MAG TPA: metallophosphoesterase [Chitinophagales bacterium]|nr:metallophosphoesterase [Chitinophagales bacterium]HMY41952.1 metallophosphoesterase [Chitinophagales bacterium]
MTKHLIIPDTQVKHGLDFSYLRRIGQYIIDKKPDVVVHLGDFADMESLSSYDVGKKSFEGKRYVKDIAAAKEAMDKLLGPMREFNIRAKKNKEKQYKPRLVLCLGNHEERIERAVNSDPKLEGLIKYEDLPYEDWEVHSFLKPVFIDGIAYCHYFPTGVMGRPSTTATSMVSKLHMSCIAGHQQGKQVAYGKRPDGSTITCIIAGSCYEHNETYLDHQSNNHFRGILLAHRVNNGCFDECFVSLDYLKERYD